MSYHALSYIDVAAAAALILINGIVSIALRLRMERSLLLASVRTTVQLLLVGFVLRQKACAPFSVNWKIPAQRPL